MLLAMMTDFRSRNNNAIGSLIIFVVILHLIVQNQR
jgi:hypothetical protein